MTAHGEEERAALCAKFPDEFEHGYRTGYHTWPLGRKNAWFAGFNLGHTEREAGDG